jgi:mRNA interferase MazF
MAAKGRPSHVVSVEFGDADRALITILPHTTSLSGSQYEIPVSVPFLKAGAFSVQSVATYPNVRAIRKLGALKPDQFHSVFAVLLR